MFAVIKTGGKQYTVAANDLIRVEKMPHEAGARVALTDVLMVIKDGKAEVGAPTVAGATVVADVLDQIRGDKVIAFKKRRRQNSRHKRGHRQHVTLLRISHIVTGGAAPDLTPQNLEELRAASRPKRVDSRNLSLISGIGDVLEDKLRDAGIRKWEQIARWSETDVAYWDKKLELQGRITRDEWIAQAKELLTGQAPRAASDRAELASGQDQ
jgi:large subunit ribosomal protein L21